MRGRSRRRQSGQVAVETALIIPLYVFLILGILQLGLIAQARVMAKYAAYRAVRVGAMHNASPKAMEAAAVFHLMPVLTDSQGKKILPNDSSSRVVMKYGRLLGENSLGVGQMVKVVICGPTDSELSGSGGQALAAGHQSALHGRGSRNEVDFDDPRLMISEEEDQDPQTGPGMRQYNRLRLRAQLQLLYRMPIPFANWIITRTYLGATLPSVLMMTQKGVPNKPSTATQASSVRALEAMKIYTIPINVSYAMRMQSNFFLNKFALPKSNECIHYKP
ncbi:pilus assembly protein [Archangium primigenium]|nr:TadE/TadG family type IV pilus assembly protein [Archangium primigenium]MBM7114213.1 pilus assembly protein [Archangium primigenium]